MTRAAMLSGAKPKAPNLDIQQKFELISRNGESAVDWVFLSLLWAVVSVGIVLIATASVGHADSLYGDPLFFVKRHSMYLVLGVVGAGFVAALPTSLWRDYGVLFLILAVVLLAAVLMPGLGKKVNGSQRWFNLGFITVQASELVKFCMIVFFSSYLSRKQIELTEGWKGFLVSMGIIGVIAALLLLEPDFGSTVVISATCVAILFLAGMRLFQFGLVVVTGAGLLAALAMGSEYRMERLIGFLDPWKVQFDSGYQLTQSLIAFGRGEWFGLGLGGSIQKLFYLPEAHTDFIVAILAEEFGLIGVAAVLMLFAALIARILMMAKRAMDKDDLFVAFSAFGIAVMFSAQVFINVGVASGLLPTKGLTLPFVSWGGSSLLANFALVGYLLRLDWEVRLAPAVAEPKRKKQKTKDLKSKDSKVKSKDKSKDKSKSKDKPSKRAA